jgi:hypothetical protein
MDARTVADVEGWESRPFGGGYDGLHDLADREFTGCVVAGDSYLFMVRGRVVGVFDYTEPSMGEPTVEAADIDRFEDADGTAYEAPEPALALLYAMAASGGETRGRYYSNDTPLEEVDRTLQDGGFTGYLELSENVLSGDYYLVYHGGRRRSVAFVGQSRRLKADEEAFDLAADEVGIYEVTAVPLSMVEIPGSPPGGDPAVVPDAGPDQSGVDDDGEAEGGRKPGAADEPSGNDVATALDEAGGPSARSDDAGETAETEPDRPEFDLDAAIDPRAEGDDEGERATGAAETAPYDGTPGEDDGDDELDDGGDGTGSDATDRPEAGGASGAVDLDGIAGPDDAATGGVDTDGTAEDEEAGTDDGEGEGGDDGGEPGADTAAEPETGTPDAAAEKGEAEGETGVESAISAVPDDETVGPGEGTPGQPTSAASGPAGEATPEDVEAAAAAAEAEIGEGSADEAGTEEPGPAEGGAESGTATGGVDDARVVPSVDPGRTARADRPDGTGNGDQQLVDGETVAGLRSELAARESRIESLRERLDSVEGERDDLAERVSELERRLAESGAAPVDDTREMSPAEALSGTSVLVRYRSKSDPTLDEVHDGGGDRESLAANLTLEPHATFDTEGLSIGGLTFGAFLEGTQAYGFLEWLVEEFPFQVRETESTVALGPLYDALPTLDRVEFDATVTLEGGDRETARFDLVARDRRGNPLFVAHLEDDRVPTDGTALGEFLTEATAAAESHESLVAAFAVTASYFEPEALRTAEDATGGSLLSRSKRESFVKTSRKGGYHLCLVEDREESFHLSVPEL